ncbi:MAG: hypothetical protein WC832_07540 [Anaerolineales bacterium]
MNIRLTYEYRDNANYHVSGEIVFANPGSMPVQLIERQLRVAMEGHEHFIARQVAIPEVFFEKESYPYGDEDHSWHTLVSVSETRDPETDEASRTIAHFIEKIRQASKVGWDWKQVPELLLMYLQAKTVPLALESMNELARAK